jgi:condensin complex subunit 3
MLLFTNHVVCRDEEVQNETVKLICTSWMKTAKFNPITIMKHLNVVENEDACEKVIQVLLDADDEMLAEHLSDPEIRAYWQGIETATTPVVVVDANNNKPSTQLLDVNMVFFARARCQYVKDTNKRAKNVTTTRQAEAILSKVLPDIPVLCEIFERHSAALIKAVVAGGQKEDDNDSDMDDDESNNRRSSSLSSSLENAEKNQDSLTLTCLQLLQMACMSSSEMEEGSRLHLKQTMTNMLGSIITPDDVVEGCMVTLQAIHNVNGGEVDFCRCVSDIVHQLQRDAEVAVSSGDDGLNDNRLLRILSILSILFEKVSSVSPSIVADLATVIVPAARCETNELVREAAVSCIGKLGLFTPEQTVLGDFKPLLLKIVSNKEETLEIRAQAMLALCDWSILFSDTLGPCPVVADGDDDNDDSTPLVVTFPDLVFAMMAHEELGMVCVAAEVACKLLITGKICDSSWLARLVTLFFDVRLNDDDEVMEDDDNDCNQPDAAAASEVGSPVRLQQLLSLFFPAYSHKSEQNRHGLVGALSMILDSLLALHSQKRRRGAKSPVSVSKVLDYVVDTVYAADQTVQENLANKALKQGTQQQKESTVSFQFSTPVLMAAIQMASFCSKEHSNCKVVFLRAICKHLGSTAVVNLQVEREKDRDLSVLMDLMEELSTEITDATCLKSLALLNDVLDTIELDDDDEKVDGDKKEEEDASSQDDGAESIVDAMQTMAISPATNRLDKENQSKDSGPRGGASTSSSGGGNRGGGSSSERQRLSNSNEGGVLGSSYQSEDSSPRGGASTSSSGGGKHRTGKIERQRRKRLSNSNEGGVLGSC